MVHGHPEDLTWAGQPAVVALTFSSVMVAGLRSLWSITVKTCGCQKRCCAPRWRRRGEAGLIVSVALEAVEKAATAAGPARKLPFGGGRPHFRLNAAGLHRAGRSILSCVLARVRKWFDGAGWFVGGAVVLLVFALLAVLAGLQSPDSMLWTGQQVTGTEQQGLVYYRWQGQSYSLDVPGSGSSKAVSVYFKPGDPSPGNSR